LISGAPARRILAGGICHHQDAVAGNAAEDAGAEIDGKYLEWLAAIAPESGRRLRNQLREPGDDERRRLLEWLADISPEHERQLRELPREEAIAAEVRERSRQIVERLEHATEVWDDSKHPRAGGPPNAGWFISTGGSTASRPRAQTQHQSLTPSPIRRASSTNSPRPSRPVSHRCKAGSRGAPLKTADTRTSSELGRSGPPVSFRSGFATTERCGGGRDR
jgi:DNA-directed RNA polymerase subunit F